MSNQNNNSSLIDVNNVSASSYIIISGNTHSTTPVEASLSVIRELKGIYYTELNPMLYASDKTYELQFRVKYTSDAPERIITSRFRIKTYNIANQIEYEITGTFN